MSTEISTLPPLDQVDRTKAFTPEQYEELRQLPSAERYAYMRRDAAKMSQKDREIHYQSQNFPKLMYNGKSPNPPQMRGVR